MGYLLFKQRIIKVGLQGVSMLNDGPEHVWKEIYISKSIKTELRSCKSLEEKMNLSTDKFIPIVAFSGNSDIKVKMSKPVEYIGQLKRVIQSYIDIKFTEQELTELVLRIRMADVTTKESKKELGTTKGKIRELLLYAIIIQNVDILTIADNIT